MTQQNWKNQKDISSFRESFEMYKRKPDDSRHTTVPTETKQRVRTQNTYDRIIGLKMWRQAESTLREHICVCRPLPATTDVCKTRGCNYSFEILMMSGVSLKTC